MAVHVESTSTSQNTNNLYELEQEVMAFCSHYTSKVPKHSVHELMHDVEQFSNNLLSKLAVPLHVQCRWLTAIANQPWLIPESYASAEVQVNALLQYMSSSCVWVRSLACSLIRVFCIELNPRGEHILTQVTISCKNLMTTLEHSLAPDINPSSSLCQVVACSSLCYVTTYWVAVIPDRAASFVLITTKCLLNVLEKPRPEVTPFLYQVAADGLGQILQSPSVWLVILTEKDRQEIVLRLMSILQYFSSPHGRENITLVKLLQTVNVEAFVHTLMTSPHLARMLLTLLLNFLQISSDDVPFLEVHWLSLCIIWRFLHFVGITPADNSSMVSMINKGCCDADQVSQLNKLVTVKYAEYVGVRSGVQDGNSQPTSTT
ncbi:uncharacterized protein LOC116616374 [Nematostella vectensis]|uniref:uncharacterized protein LOC116616374 n=1 Tax=Nematostella vectensis TaxID=45351 RepID=UPI0013904EC8|nr:uncharacterized protein LOC116616374 [Nematostella vectensis]